MSELVTCLWFDHGESRQIMPKRLLDLTTSSNRDKAKPTFEAMITMRKIDIGALEAAATAG